MTTNEALARALDWLKLKEPVPPPALWIFCRFCGWIGGGHHPEYPDPRCGKEDAGE